MISDTPCMARFRNNLLAIVKSRRMTIARIGQDTGIHGPGISRIINGHESCTISRAERIAQAIGLPLPYLLAKEEREILRDFDLTAAGKPAKRKPAAVR